VPGDTVPEAFLDATGAKPGDVVPPGMLLLQGDNPRSIDSRRLGYCPLDRVRGTVRRRIARAEQAEP